MTITAQDLQTLSPRDVGASQFCDMLFEYLTVAGQSRYDESVTQLEHGLQCAHLAEQAGFDSTAQIAALLHDIGHLVLDEHAGHGDFLDDDLGHEIVGARLLPRWFGAEIGQPVALPVTAKRYLVATEPGYADEQLDGYYWHSFMLHDPQLKLWIKVAQREYLCVRPILSKLQRARPKTIKSSTIYMTI